MAVAGVLVASGSQTLGRRESRPNWGSGGIDCAIDKRIGQGK